MFARKVSAGLREGKLDEFLQVMEEKIVPWLRSQNGFQALITLAAADQREIAAISFWDAEVHAKAYEETGYPEVLGILRGMLDGRPYVKTFQVMGSTVPSIPASQGKAQMTE